jgi:hypothetical protein
MWNAVLGDPCLRQYDHRKLLVLHTHISLEGFGYVACQLVDNDASTAAMHKCMQGGSFDFMTKDSTALLHPVAFGCSRTCGNKQRLHSHLGEAFSGNYAINKCQHMAFGQRFIWVMDYYALKFIQSYNGWNPAILCLQMRFMCWDMVVKHRNDVCLTDAEYFSHLGMDLCFDPLLKEYVQQVVAFRCRSPAPKELPIAPKHQPYFRGPHLNMPRKAAPTASDRHAHNLDATAALITTRSQHLSNWPVHFRTAAMMDIACNASSRCLYNFNITQAASMLFTFDWAIYGFNSGHILSTIHDRSLPFKVVLECNPFAHGCALFCKLSECKTIMSSASAILDHICSSGFTSKLTGYAIHSHQYLSTEPTSRFWEIQSNIVKQLCLI